MAVSPAATWSGPACKRLLADVEAGQVDVIVVYKVDRLTRALADFAKIVDVLRRNDGALRLVTQPFNTTTSMGRLTLNVLLSFAQFEREVTGERIRDKIAASKKRGHLDGRPVPLGYEVRERKLIVNERSRPGSPYLQRYVDARLRPRLIEELARGHRTKVAACRMAAMRRHPFRRGHAVQLLNEPHLSRTRSSTRATSMPGEHEAIICPQLWEDVQQSISANRVERRERHGIPNASLLAGIIYDDAVGG